MQTKWLQDNFNNKTKWLNYLLLTIVFAVNFMGHPGLKYVYLVYSIFIFISILTFKSHTVLPLIISYAFIEGQGRILWGYHPASRIAFDLLIAIATVKGFITNKDIKLARLLPHHMLILIALHFLWYLVEMFNVDGINTLAAIAGTKVYIFPFFLFIYFRQNEDFFVPDNLKSVANLIIFLLFMESALALYQLQHLENFMISISSNYVNAMRGDIFTMSKFRPFGTTQLPGAISVFIFLTTGLIFVRRKMTAWLISGLIFLLPLFFVVLIVCQVRSAMLKFFVVFIGILISLFVNSQKKIATTIRVAALTLVILPVITLVFYPKIEKYIDTYINIEAGLQRWEGFEGVEDVAAHRVTPSYAFDIALKKLAEFPMGIGPAMTGAAGSLSVDLIQKDPIYNKQTFWGYDNFYLSMIIEFGYGAIFYLAYFFSVPFALIYFFKEMYRNGDYLRSRLISIALVNIVVILLGNWGAQGISYNPESFFFWFWAAIGFNTYYLAQKEASSKNEIKPALNVISPST